MDVIFLQIFPPITDCKTMVELSARFRSVVEFSAKMENVVEFSAGNKS